MAVFDQIRNLTDRWQKLVAAIIFKNNDDIPVKTSFIQTSVGPETNVRKRPNGAPS
ncbi:hypothetical protein KIN20_014503 [Parelaphostrongylus tenuis]|uniref:Uncharacterized protein n=1 Tax=Parelaphostrongylus tenuis TaxID=148309 RepID=A0AAD5MDS7_PARTN|nr:hypothetical protein KIN20_014503 [Parelaphostrongylus tenuis]